MYLRQEMFIRESSAVIYVDIILSPPSSQMEIAGCLESSLESYTFGLPLFLLWSGDRRDVREFRVAILQS